MKEVMEYSFTVNPEERKFVLCKVPSPFKITSIIIERENVEIFSFSFDGLKKTEINASRGHTLLHYPITVRNDFSFGVNGRSITVPEEVKVLLVGEFVE
jgi:hypothetical protein